MTFFLKRIKTIIVLSVKEKDLSAFSLIKKNTLHYDKNWLLRTTKIICENKNKGLMSQWSNNFQKFVSILYFLPTIYFTSKRTIYRTPNFLCLLEAGAKSEV